MALTLAQAVACIERGCAKARELGFEVAVAVVDDGGPSRGLPPDGRRPLGHAGDRPRQGQRRGGLPGQHR